MYMKLIGEREESVRRRPVPISVDALNPRTTRARTSKRTRAQTKEQAHGVARAVRLLSRRNAAVRAAAGGRHCRTSPVVVRDHFTVPTQTVVLPCIIRHSRTVRRRRNNIDNNISY